MQRGVGLVVREYRWIGLVNGYLKKREYDLNDYVSRFFKILNRNGLSILGCWEFENKYKKNNLENTRSAPASISASTGALILVHYFLNLSNLVDNP